MDGIRWRMTKLRVTEEDAGDSDMWRNLVLSEGNLMRSG
jgi:hypothetical protein